MRLNTIIREFRYDILAVGGINIDLVLTAPQWPNRGDKATGRFKGRFPGGPAANFACAAGRYGACVAAVGTVGDDVSGELILEDFARFGVDTTHVQVRPNYETPFTIVAIDPSGERTIIVPEFADHIPPAEIGPLLSRTRALYTMPRDMEAYMEIASAAQRARVTVMIDVEPTLGLNPTGLERILQVTRIVSFNQAGFEASVGKPPSIEAARELLPLGPHTVVVTLGSAGSLAVTRDQAAEVQAFPVDVRDTTGAGDIFNAGFLIATLAQAPLRERLLFANAGSALASGCVGARGCLPSRDQVISFLRDRSIQMSWS